MAEVEERPQFYEGQYLEAADLMAVIDYPRAQLGRVLVGAHTWGIALGLDLVEVPGPNGTLDVFVEPGYAWDGFGRAIVVGTPTKLVGSLFATFDSSFVQGAPPPAPVAVDVWITYDETATQGPRPGFQTCDPTSALSRVMESFRIEASLKIALSDQRDEIVIAGRAMDAAQALTSFDAAAPALVDASVPQQDLPDAGDRKNWFIPLGTVLWQPGAPGRFVKRTQVELDRSKQVRRYAGVVAASIEGTAGRVRVHDRGKPYSTSFTEELLWVEGELRLDGHARVYGKRIEFVQNHAENPRAPFHILRTDDVGSGKKNLQLVIGDQAAGANKLAVGPKNGVDLAGNDTYNEVLVVTDSGNVGIGTLDPIAPLQIKGDGLQIGTSATPGDNFYIQSNTDGPRALRIYNKNMGSGTHVASFTQTGRLGVGVNDPTNVLHVNGSLGVRQNALYMSGDSDWSSVTFNAHHNEANNNWVFPDPSKPAMTIEMDSIGGDARFELFSTVTGNNQAWISRLKVFGHGGNVAMAYNGGNVGVGTTAPAQKLDVAGDIQTTGNVRLAAGAYRAAGAVSPVRIVWGTISTGTVVAAGEGFTISRTDVGRYLITFNPPFPSRPSASVTKIFGNPDIDAATGVDPGESAIIDLIQTNQMIVATGDSGGTLIDSAFTFLVIGPR
jgi:hypothetical protein